MELKKLLLALTIAFPTALSAQEEAKPLTFSGYGEAYVQGSQEGWQTPLPHLLFGAEWNIAHGWSAYGELEYNDRLDATQLYVQKSFGDVLALRLGKMTAPIGMANIYDNPMDHFGVTLPFADELVSPRDSNLPGISLSGTVKTFDWEIQGLLHGDTIVAVARLHNQFSEHLDAALGAFYDGKVILSADANYVSNAFVTRAIATHNWREEATHIGLETGYNLLTTTHFRSSLFLFARYDFLHQQHNDKHLFTVGINYRPVDYIVIKADYATDFRDTRLNHCLAIGIGVTLP